MAETRWWNLLHSVYGTYCVMGNTTVEPTAWWQRLFGGTYCAAFSMWNLLRDGKDYCGTYCVMAKILLWNLLLDGKDSLVEPTVHSVCRTYCVMAKTLLWNLLRDGKDSTVEPTAWWQRLYCGTCCLMAKTLLWNLLHDGKDRTYCMFSILCHGKDSRWNLPCFQYESSRFSLPKSFKNGNNGFA